MKTKSSLESAFFNPRALIGFGFGVIGLLLGLVAFIALPKQSALAIPAPCTTVAYSEDAGPSCSILVTMESHSEGYPNSPCTIYYSIGTLTPPDPTHSSPTYSSPIVVAYGQIRRMKAFGHKQYANPEDSAINGYAVYNTSDCGGR